MHPIHVKTAWDRVQVTLLIIHLNHSLMWIGLSSTVKAELDIVLVVSQGWDIPDNVIKLPNSRKDFCSSHGRLDRRRNGQELAAIVSLKG